MSRLTSFQKHFSVPAVLSLVLLLLCASIVTANTTTVNFSDTTGYGLSTDRVMIDNIRLDATVVNPFDPSRPTIVNYYFNVPFYFDPVSLHLIPDLTGAVQVDSNTSCAGLTVHLSNAYTGQPISGGVVTVGSATATTNSSGLATFSNLVAGMAQIGGTASGYVSATRSATLTCTESTSIGLALSPSSGTGSVASGEVRIVLTWGQNPSDLDSHLTGPTSSSTGVTDETNRFHVYYMNETEDVANLDVDDTTSYGPETITISQPGSGLLRQGLYRYSVHHYSGSSTISSSNANVSLQIGSGTVRNYTPPAGATMSGDVWTVFELSVAADGSITVYDVNTLTAGVSASSVRSTETGYGEVESGIDFSRLPGK